LFNIEKFDTNNIKMIENSLNEMENEQIRESDSIHLIKYCIDNRYKDRSLHKKFHTIILTNGEIHKYLETLLTLFYFNLVFDI
jgi:hypothetical protein